MSDWPPNYTTEFKTRLERLKLALDAGPDETLAYYRTRPKEFINHWCMTYDPRNAGSDVPTMMPLCMFPRQEDLVDYLLSCLEDGENGLIEKSRDMGATWVCCAFSVWAWLFKDGASIGWGSRKQELVDRLGVTDSIFEKLRVIINSLPPFFLPKGFDTEKHMNFMKITNPQTGGSISGEAGDNIGRGGRSSIYFKDESAHYERPEKIEAALGDNTDCQIDISSVNGTGNVFYRRRMAGNVWPEKESGKTRVFIMAWSDHPHKTQEWYDKRRSRAEDEGLMHLFAQEVDRDYASAIENVVIPAEWVMAAVDAHKKLKLKPEGIISCGFDVADGGSDKSAVAVRKGSFLQHISAWGGGDTHDGSVKALRKSQEFKVDTLSYDSIGVGAGAKASFNKMDTGAIKIYAWAGSGKVFNPDKRLIKGDRDSPLNKDFFLNLKSQGWWELRRRFKNTYDAVIKGKELSEDLIILPSDLKQVHELVTELSQPTFSYTSAGKLLIDKKPDGSKSPNLADALVMAYWVKARPIFYA